MAQTQTSSINKLNTQTQQKRALRIAILMAGATLAFVIPYYYWAYQLQAWQLYVLATALLGFAGLVLYSIWLIRRNKSVQGIRLIILGMFVLFPLSVCFAANLGLVLGLSLVLLVSIITVQTLPHSQSGPLIVASIAIGLLTIFIDIYLFELFEFEDYRLFLPVLQQFVPWFAGAIVIVYAFFVVQQFSSYSLRTKLILAFLITSIVAVGVVAFIANRSSTASLTESQGLRLEALADTQALLFGNLIVRQLESLQSLSLSRNINNRLVLANNLYTGNPQEDQAAIDALQLQWEQAKDDTDLIVGARLRNSAAIELRTFQSVFPNHTQLLITDRLGVILAATNRTANINQVEEEWWQAAYNNGRGNVYISPPVINDDDNNLSITIALPFYDDVGNVLGILKSQYDLSALAGLLLTTESKAQNIHTDILLPDGQLIDLDKAKIEHLEPGELAQLRQLADQPFANFVFEGEPAIVSQAVLATIEGSPEINQLGWRIITHQDEKDALAPVETQTNNILLLAMIVIGIAVGAAVFVAQRLTEPIVQLTQTAEKVSQGDYTAQARVQTADEIGTLAGSFNSMTKQLQDTITGLEDRVNQRTRQLQLVLQISQELSQILDLNELMQQIVILTKETFSFYHVHIYLLDENKEFLVMTEGYGSAGAQMKREGHSIAFDSPKSLVARAAREEKTVYISDVYQDSGWLPNPLLPDTRSEMAAPIMLVEGVVGVLDVQSEHTGGLSEADVFVLQALANQIAVAIRNARLFSETKQALSRAEELQRIYSGRAWEDFRTTQIKTNFEVKQGSLPPIDEISVPEVEQALQERRTVDWSWAGVGNGKTNVPAEQSPATEQALATPLQLGSQIIGVLGIRDNNPSRKWTEEEVALIESVSEQMSLALENARLFNETQKRAAREEIIAELTRNVWSGDDIQTVLHNAVTQLGSTLKASKVVLRLGTERTLGEKRHEQ